jgi:hypothetical protein
MKFTKSNIIKRSAVFYYANILQWIYGSDRLLMNRANDKRSLYILNRIKVFIKSTRRAGKSLIDCA